MSDTEPTTTATTPMESPIPLQTLHRVWSHAFPHTCDRDPAWMFIIDEGVPGAVVAAFQGDEDFSGLTVPRSRLRRPLSIGEPEQSRPSSKSRRAVAPK